MTKFPNWKNETDYTNEDRLIVDYWSLAKGIIITEFGLGGRGPGNIWPKGSKPRRLDALRTNAIVPDYPESIYRFSYFDQTSLSKLINEHEVEVIEAKSGLGRYVIGQVIIGSDLIELEYRPKSVKQIILAMEADPLLKFICARRGISVLP